MRDHMRKSTQERWLLAAALVALAAAQKSCNFDLYGSAYDFQYDVVLLATLQSECKASIRALAQQPFGPPTSFEVMNAMCKGVCRQYYENYQRLAKVSADTGCSCPANAPRCPIPRTALLCHLTGLCYEEAYYEDAVCAPDACGRFLASEREYRGQRRACGQSLDGASSASLAPLAAAVVVLCGWHLLRQQRHEGEG